MEPSDPPLDASATPSGDAPAIPPDTTPPATRPGVLAPLLTAAALIAPALAMMLARREGMPTAAWLAQYASTDALDPAVAGHAEEVLVVPFGALISVCIRLTLGLRMLGPFRPVLIALAFEFTGILVGLTFVASVMAFIALLRPRLRSDWLPYASRLSIILVVVVILQVTFVFVSSALGWSSAMRSAFFPIIVLCLAADGFARVLAEEGYREATWRGTTTMLAALIISLMFGLPGVAETLVAYPELMLVQIAAIVLVSRFAAPRWLETWNPLAARKR